MERTWAPLLPLWTALILNLKNNEIVCNNQVCTLYSLHRVTTNYNKSQSVESWFGTQKHKNMDKKKNRRVDGEDLDDCDGDSRWSYDIFLKKLDGIYR